MYAFLNKYGQALAFGIGVLVVAIFMISIFSGTDAEMELLMSESAGPEKYDTKVFDFGLGISLILTALAFVIALVFGIVQFAGDPKGVGNVRENVETQRLIGAPAPTQGATRGGNRGYLQARNLIA